MKFTEAAGANPTDAMRILGRPTDRIEGPMKVTGRATYAAEFVVPDMVYGMIVTTTIASGRIVAIDTEQALAAPGVLAVITHENAGALALGDDHKLPMLAGPQVDQFGQTAALVVADSFEAARAAAGLVRIDYAADDGVFDLADAKDGAERNSSHVHGDFDQAFADAPVQVDATYTTPDHAHAMMEPHASIASWDGDELTLRTANQMVDWAARDMAKVLGMPKEKVRIVAHHIGGGFGGKLWVRADAVLAAVAARQVGRPVKVVLTRPQVFNNTPHRSATIQRLRLGATREGRLTAIGHESWSGDVAGGSPEGAGAQTRQLYAAPHRRVDEWLATLNLPESNAMRAPGEAVGMMAIEAAMDELAERLGIDPVELRILNDTQVDPEKPERRFSHRDLIGCLREGAERFGWSARVATPGMRRDGRWLVGMGMAAAYRGNIVLKSAARVEVSGDGRVTVTTDMTDIGTGSYTILAQTAAEMLGVDLDQVTVRLGESTFPISAGSGGQFGANSSTAGVYAACVGLRDRIAEAAGFEPATARFADSRIWSGNKSVALGDAVGGRGIEVEDRIEFGNLTRKFVQATFGAHFVEVGVDADTAEIRVRRMLGVFGAGRILNPKSARSQILGAMTMGVGAALTEELVIDPRLGGFINHDMAEYHVPTHADIPHQEVVFLDEADPLSSPMKAKGVGELGICGVGAAVANAIYNACGVRVRDYPIAVDKLLAGM
ncbi:xanthine dehydrogenase family protein molybdopterin-binding subunit [Sphingomonas sp. Leaf10]|uniref:xanthine dehydrogenase family protein molybdopterin-binding subunit n=1 Tax=Sphingomonas sp. Leaf10 TaxID=1735676 RepID=UPI0006FF9479|nr:xanthine dehydrogenase family protein molybdopterin-binding subunit [Sphingomonas sp. Leaf10]KQM41323.1 xanthine dehydrogenase [Sphingomonas sp. Leaf10]